MTGRPFKIKPWSKTSGWPGLYFVWTCLTVYIIKKYSSDFPYALKLMSVQI
jgi:hypothetical protein